LNCNEKGSTADNGGKRPYQSISGSEIQGSRAKEDNMPIPDIPVLFYQATNQLERAFSSED
jgi:hypothetical protein